MAKRIASQAEARGLLDDAPGVDGIVALTHSTGCGMANDGDGMATLRRSLAGYARHPNVGGVLVLGLGCEVNQVVAGGANNVCFTTGRGSVFGCKPVPSLKLSTNSETYRRMPEDMDLDCGTIVEAGESVEQAGARIFDRMIEVASGRRTASEELGFGDEEFIPWQLGAVM